MKKKNGTEKKLKWDNKRKFIAINHLLCIIYHTMTLSHMQCIFEMIEFYCFWGCGTFSASKLTHFLMHKL